MIRSRLSYVRYYLRILTLLLPACAYFIAVKIRFGFNLFFLHTPPAGLPSYWGIMLLTTIVWAIAAEESGLWSVEQLYAPGKKSRRLLEALAFTYAVVMALGLYVPPGKLLTTRDRYQRGRSLRSRDHRTHSRPRVSRNASQERQK